MSIHGTRSLNEEHGHLREIGERQAALLSVECRESSFVVLLRGGSRELILCMKIYAYYISLKSFFFEHIRNLDIESGGVEASVCQELAST